MAEKKEKALFSVTCPCCQTLLWIDKVSGEVIESEKPVRKKGSLDDMLEKEHKRISEFDRKFDAGFELEREKHTKADEIFNKALKKAESGEDDEGT